ncbi:MAG TPA: tetratricopeptide repeat protein, partial [Kofleriaceae bacterium]
MPDPKQDPSKSAVETGWEEPAHPKPPIARRPLPGLPQEKPSSPHIQTGKDESSLALLGKDLMPPPPAAQAPTQIDVSTLGNANDRKVKFPGVWITVRNWFRRWSGKFKALPKNHKRIILGLLGVAVILIVVLIAVSGEDKPKESRGSKLAKQGQELLNKNTPKHAAELIESELVGASQAGDGEAYMVLGHARFAMKRYLESLTAYERALTQDPKLASDTVLRANAIKVLDTKDSVAAVVALEILASRVQPPAHDEVVRYASSGKMQDARRR